MSDYIVCHKKRNNPRMNVRICQKKCQLKDDCKEYIAFQKVGIQSRNNLSQPTEQPLMDLVAP